MSNLNEEEKKHREELKVKSSGEKKVKDEEEKKTRDAKFAGLDPVGKI